MRPAHGQDENGLRGLGTYVAAVLLAGALWVEPAGSAVPASERPAVRSESGREQTPDNSLLSVHVITADEIRQSGATSIVEALRSVPGVDIVTISARNRMAAVRGMPEGAADPGVLLMLDGRPVNGEAAMTAYWDLLPVPLTCVERIEILRTPASLLHGPGACAGAVNIVTRAPGSAQGLDVSLTAGQYRTLIGGAVFGLASGGFGLTVSAEVDQTDEWGGKAQSAGDILRVNGDMRYRYSDDGHVTLRLGRVHTDQARLPSQPAAGMRSMSGNVYHAHVEALYRAWVCRVSLLQENFSGRWRYGEREQEWLSSAVDAGVEHSFAAGTRNTVAWGVTYRTLTAAPNDLLPAYHAQHLAGVFVRDDIRWGERWHTSTGLRYDYHSLTQSSLSWLGTLRFSPSAGHTLRLALANGFRNPSLLDSYAAYTVRDTADRITIINVVGQSGLEPRRVRGVELAYLGHVLGRLRVGATTYYRYHRGLYSWRVDTMWVAAPDSVGLERRLDHSGRARGLGGELELQYHPAEWLVVRANYSRQGLLEDWAESAAGYFHAPRNKLNIGLHATMAGLRIGAWLHWSEATTWRADDGSGGGATYGIGDRLLVNARLGYAGKNAEVSGTVSNLLDRPYREYPEALGGEELRRKVSVQLGCRF